MKIETFFDNFKVLAEAPNSVKKLQEMILELAVRGKLVAQDERDEPAYNLIKRIKFKKGQLIKENKIKNIEALAPINKTEVPYFLPKGWDWAHIGDLILSITGGGTPSKNNPQFWNGNIPWASVKDLGKSKYLENTIDFITEKGIQNSSTNLIPKGRVIICTRMGLGKIAINKIDVAINQDLKAIELPEEFNENYFYNFYITQNIKGSGMTVSGIRQTELLNMLVPVPPLAEQNRIVAKVDQLMSLCDELEARQQKKRETRARINSAALDRLLAARAPGEFAQGWRRISDNFDLLYDAPENVGALRKVIIQLAVRGKLVPQNPNDEPASILLERIIFEKKKLMKEGKIKETVQFPIENEGELFELPSKWKWTCLYDIGKINPRNITEDDTEVSFIPMTLISETSIKPIGSEKRRWGDVKKGFTHFAEDDVVLAKITPCFQNGKSALMRGLSNNLGAGTTELHVFRPILNESVNTEYVLLYLRSPQFLSEGIEKMTGTAGQKRVPKDYFAGNPFPLPPFEEQHRIVARVDQLMSLCDELEAGLMRSQADSEKLMEAVVGKMLAGGSSNK
jgi:type I restriction enzyme S subunit